MSRPWDYRGSSIEALRQQAPQLRFHMKYLAALYNKGVMTTDDGQPTKEGVDWLKAHPKDVDPATVITPRAKDAVAG